MRPKSTQDMATWILTALDAGFWTAMDIRPAPLRHIASLFFSVWYLFQADSADVKVRKLRSDCTVRMMRTSWEKSTSPFLWAVAYFQRPSIGYCRNVWVSRDSPFDTTRFSSWRNATRVKMFYAGTEKELGSVHKLVLHFPGGGFITMAPENHEEYLRRWARAVGKSVAIASVDYCKAPEFQYPYALEECYDLYKKICLSDGNVLGLNTVGKASKKGRLRVAIAGDSAGGNLTAGVTIKIIEEIISQEKASLNVPFSLQLTSERPNERKLSLKRPDGIMLIYGALNFDMASWIAPDDSNAKLLRPGSETSLSGLMKNYKGTKYHENRLRSASPTPKAVENVRIEKFAGLSSPFLSLTSRVAYFNDRIIPPELARAMSLLYLGTHATVNPATDYYLSPINCPEEILMEFPRVWMMCGECDPFVDDTVVFAARVRLAQSRKMDRMVDIEDDGHTTDQSDTKTKLIEQTIEEAENSDEALNNSDQSRSKQNSNVLSRAANTFRRMLNLTPAPDPGDSDAETARMNVPEEEVVDGDEDEYGEINQDPQKYVTVKIYAGLSHAYLQMLNFLPEAHHAAALTSEWLCEIFELGDRIARRRKLRSMRKKKLKQTVRLEMRDEDNIPDTISLPPGAEYRIGRTEIKLRSSAQQLDESFRQLRNGSQRKNKYTIGDSDDEEQSIIPITDEQRSSNSHPLQDAIVSKKQFLYPRLKARAPATVQRSSSPKSDAQKPTTKPSDLFLSEADLLTKRNSNLVQEVYSGVDPNLVALSSSNRSSRAQSDIDSS